LTNHEKCQLIILNYKKIEKLNALIKSIATCVTKENRKGGRRGEKKGLVPSKIKK